MDLVVRAIEESEIPAMIRTDAAGFGEDGASWGKEHARWIALDLERTACAFEGDALVGTSRNYSLEVTPPGGAPIAAAGVSAVAVLPTHRRRGILRAMMDRLLDDAIERAEPVAMLTASESGIYGRFGFGVATRAAAVDLPTHEVEFTGPRPAGRLRMVEPDELRKLAPALFDRVRAGYPGAVSRPDEWWAELQYHKEFGTRFDTLFESEDGEIDGYVTYSIKDKWGASGADNTLTVRDLVAAAPDAVHALWRYVCEVDLVRRVHAGPIPVDSALPWMLVSPRVARWTSVYDYVWHRVLDVPTTLAARRYSVPGQVVIGVHDPIRPGGRADGTFAIEGGPDGAQVTATDERAELECDVTTLSTAWCGGVRWSELAGAGRVREQVAGALARADAMFASTPLPFGFTSF